MAFVLKERIVEVYNKSVDAVTEAYKYGEAKNLNQALFKTSQSAGYIYNAIEWFLKNYLMTVFNDPVLHSVQYQTIEGTRFHPKLELFKNSASPNLTSAGIDIKVIGEFKQTVRNDPEHSGIAPHFSSLQIVIKETRKLLITYLRISENELRKLENSYELKIDVANEWLLFFDSVEKFDSNCNYILVSNTSTVTPEVLSPLGLIDWKVVFDFDPKSSVNGLFKVSSPEILAKRAVHQLTLSDTLPSPFSERSCYWIYSNGLEGRNGTHFDVIRDWNRNYSTFLNRVIQKIQASLAAKPTVAVIVYNSFSHVSELVKLLYNSFGSSIKFVFANSDLVAINELSNEYGGQNISITIPEISNGLLSIRTYFNPALDLEEYIIPHKDSTFAVVSERDFNWVSEDLEVVHKNIYTDVSEIENERIAFYKGGKITWKGLHLGFDLNRDCLDNISDLISRRTRERNIQVINIFHYPGIGGSTIAKRTAWNFKDSFPVSFLRTYRVGESIARVYKLFQLSSLPPLIILDSSDITEESKEKIFKEAQIKNFPVVFIWVQRRTVQPNKLLENEVYISEVLADREVYSFAHSYSEFAPERKATLLKIISSIETKEKHPLYFGLAAFEKDFTGLTNFIEKAFLAGNILQRKIVGIISLIGIYAQKAVSAQVFTGILGLPESSNVKLERYIDVELLHLIINESSLNWRPLHFLIANQYLLKLYGAESNVALLRNGLSDLSIEFIDLLGNRSFDPSGEELEILNRLFIDRTGNGTSGPDDDSSFSKLINDGLSDDISRLRVFEKLTTTFPDEIHFWSHLARFYNLVIKDYDKAQVAIDEAISLDSLNPRKDATLYHIKGMIFKSQAAALMNGKWNDKNVDDELVNKIKELIKLSGNQFEIARDSNPSNEYGYVTNIDAITHYLDFKFSVSKYSERSIFLVNMDQFDLILFNEAVLLLEDLRSMISRSDDDFYFNRSKSKIEVYFSNYSIIIQGWQNLLDPSKQSNKSTVRQLLVHAYVGRAAGWEKLDQRDIDKVLDLLEENITLDPRDSKSIYLWFKAARYSDKVSIKDAINKLARWRLINGSIDSIFYLSILNVIEAIEGNSLAKVQSEQLIREMSENSRNSPYRTLVSEWYGSGNELGKIVSRKIAQVFDNSREMKFNESMIKYVDGKVSSIKGPEGGTIELLCGLQAFFIPARADQGKGLVRGRDENSNVKFLLGFSYDGLKAYEVKPILK